MNLLKKLILFIVLLYQGNVFSQTIIYQKKTDWLGNQYIISTPINTSKSNNSTPKLAIDNIMESKKQQIPINNDVIGDWNKVKEMVMDPFRGQYPGALTYSVTNAWGANIYYKPSIKGKIIEVLKYYDQVKVIDKNGDWLKVYTPNGNHGWVKNNLVN